MIQESNAYTNVGFSLKLGFTEIMLTPKFPLLITTTLGVLHITVVETADFLELVSITVPLKCYLATKISHSTTLCETKNTSADPHHRHHSLRIHFPVLMGITMGKQNIPLLYLSDGFGPILRPLCNSSVAKVFIV